MLPLAAETERPLYAHTLALCRAALTPLDAPQPLSWLTLDDEQSALPEQTLAQLLTAREQWVAYLPQLVATLQSAERALIAGNAAEQLRHLPGRPAAAERDMTDDSPLGGPSLVADRLRGSKGLSAGTLEGGTKGGHAR